MSSSARPGIPYGVAAGWWTDRVLGARPAMAAHGGGGNEFPQVLGRLEGA